MGLKVGDKIRIISLVDEPFNSRYYGLTGVVQRISVDPWGDERADGTWGGIGIYTNKDTYEIIG